MALTVTGVVGEVRWGYFPAGHVLNWTVTINEGVSSLTGTLTQYDALRLSQQPLVFVAPHVKGAYRWPITSLQMTGAWCMATLGPMERPRVLSHHQA
jgi:hypothetical protein